MRALLSWILLAAALVVPVRAGAAERKGEAAPSGAAAASRVSTASERAAPPPAPSPARGPAQPESARDAVGRTAEGGAKERVKQVGAEVARGARRLAEEAGKVVRELDRKLAGAGSAP